MKVAGFWNVTLCSPMFEGSSEISVYVYHTTGSHTPDDSSVFSAVCTACCRIRTKTKDECEKIYIVQNMSINSKTAEIISYTE
jgi:hypothetical protein